MGLALTFMPTSSIFLFHTRSISYFPFMQEESSPNNKSGSTKKIWLRVLIIVAIGIPVLIELSTLVNLLKVQFWGEKEDTTEQVQTTGQVREIVEGDTLFTSPGYTLRLQTMRVEVSPGSWEFKLTLNARKDTISAYDVQVDSLGLRSGNILAGKGTLEWNTTSDFEVLETTEDWEVPNGDIPNRLFLTVYSDNDPDSSEIEHLDLPLGPIPVRYDQ